MTRISPVTFLLLCSLSLASCQDRRGKFFSIFNIVSFQNSVCTSDDNLMGGNKDITIASYVAVLVLYGNFVKIQIVFLTES